MPYNIFSMNYFSLGEIAEIIEAGFCHAASCFARLINQPVNYHVFQHGIFRPDNALLSHLKLQQILSDGRLLLTTEIFGDVSGKSYLLLSETECAELTHHLPEIIRSDKINLKSEFLKELDNILSAAVITKIADSLNIKIYGDIPILIGKVNTEIDDLINRDFGEDHDQVLVSSACFSFGENNETRPNFIWVFGQDILMQSWVRK